MIRDQMESSGGEPLDVFLEVRWEEDGWICD